MVVFVTRGGQLFSVVRSMEEFNPELISHTLVLIAWSALWHRRAHYDPTFHAIVALKPARQAALQTILFVEDARFRDARLP